MTHSGVRYPKISAHKQFRCYTDDKEEWAWLDGIFESIILSDISVDLRYYGQTVIEIPGSPEPV